MSLHNAVPHYIGLCLLILLSHSKRIVAQEVINASIYEIILTAQSESPDYLLARTRQDNAKWVYTAAQSVFKPQLGFQATLPSVSRAVDQVTLPDGSRAFRNSAFMTNSVGLNLEQVVSATGGTVFVSTGLERLDLFSTNTQTAGSSYRSSPIVIGFDQPLMRFNAFGWDKKEAELIYESSKKQYVEDREAIAFDAVNFFFDLYTSKLILDEALINKRYLDSLATNAAGRYSVGRISETDLLQIQLGAKNADGTVARLELDVQNKTEALRDFLGVTKEVIFEFSPPEPLTIYSVDRQKALDFALQNRSQTQQFRLRLLQAQRQLEQAEKDNGPNLRLNGQFGLTQFDGSLSNVYQNLLDQERVSLTIDIPIADFGRRKARTEIAKSTLELTQLQLRQDQVSFEREIFVNVEQFELKRNQLKLSEEALDIALKRLDIAKKRFRIGKIDVTNLNIAIQEEQGARQQYYARLWEMWRAHYTIRNLTLYDFENNVPLD